MSDMYGWRLIGVSERNQWKEAEVTCEQLYSHAIPTKRSLGGAKQPNH